MQKAKAGRACSDLFPYFTVLFHGCIFAVRSHFTAVATRDRFFDPFHAPSVVVLWFRARCCRLQSGLSNHVQPQACAATKPKACTVTQAGAADVAAGSKRRLRVPA
eukprot:6206396-Pleurochrysis_carterae.AAC.2